MTTISKDIGRGDIALHRGCDERVGAKWMVDSRDGRGYVGKDLRKWDATFRLFNEGRQVYELPCTTASNGYAIASIPGSAFEDERWRTMRHGEWRIDARGPDGEREWLGQGAYEML